MGPVSGVVVFLMIWWVTLFTVLPWGNRPSEQKIAGQVASAPDKPRLLKKFLITTAISILLWLLVYGLIEANVLNFYNMAEQMSVQDQIKHQPQNLNTETK